MEKLSVAQAVGLTLESRYRLPPSVKTDSDEAHDLHRLADLWADLKSNEEQQASGRREACAPSGRGA
jgi:TfoX/Sxy family transcriptional regulator of competence genes